MSIVDFLVLRDFLHLLRRRLVFDGFDADESSFSKQFRTAFTVSRTKPRIVLKEKTVTMAKIETRRNVMPSGGDGIHELILL